MFARNLLAMIATLLVSTFSCLAATGALEHEVGVFLRSDGGISAPVLDALKREMNQVMNQTGFRLKWWVRQSATPIEAEEIIVVDLHGTCAVPRDKSRPLAHSSQLELASTSVVGSEVLPFSTLHCKTFNDLISTSLQQMPSSRRDAAYGRALARVLAHEFYHVLLRTRKHTANGVAKKSHSPDDLLAEHFDFDAVAISHLRQLHKLTGSEGALEAPPEPVVSLTGLADNSTGR